MLFIIAEYIKNLFNKYETSSYSATMEVQYSTQEQLDDLV
jgi:hypothetical protein